MVSSDGGGDGSRDARRSSRLAGAAEGAAATRDVLATFRLLQPTLRLHATVHLPL